MAGSFDVTSLEGLNPTRRYKFFRPRQAVRGFLSQAGANFQVVSLYNNTTAAYVLVVRDYAIGFQGTGQSAPLGFFSNQGTLGSSGGVVQPYDPMRATPPGLMYGLNTSTSYNFDYLVAGYNAANSVMVWPHDYPLSLVWPGWAFCVQSHTGGSNIYVSFIWEVISIEELDFMYE